MQQVDLFISECFMRWNRKTDITWFRLGICACIRHKSGYPHPPNIKLSRNTEKTLQQEYKYHSFPPNGYL